MNATDFIRIRGLESSPAECFQGVGGSLSSAAVTPPAAQEKPGVSAIPEAAQVADQSVIGKILKELADYVQNYAEDLQRQQASVTLSVNADITAYNQAHPDDAPLPKLPAIPDRAGPLVKFLKGWLTRLTSLPVAVLVENVDKIYYAIASVHDVVAICGKAFDFVVGHPLENGLLRYSPMDPFRLLPKSLLKEGLIEEETGRAILLHLVDALDALDVENDFSVYRQTLRSKIYRE